MKIFLIFLLICTICLDTFTFVSSTTEISDDADYTIIRDLRQLGRPSGRDYKRHIRSIKLERRSFGRESRQLGKPG